ncbi:uncharacterized protein J3D65DRAFT_113013 [Phyllosticta citribraziliensis]|uniref:DUF2207 domain-containing protein n=1 Tax=Phyllosticta citribraziliensis TaxID=989973 RepID=A0ABR1L832_9PEZI
MLRLRTFVRLAVGCLSVWIACIVLCVMVPSSSRHDNGINYPSRVVNEGERITRIYEVDRFYPDKATDYQPVLFARETALQRFALSFSLDDTRQYLVVNDLQRIAVTNINPEERVSDPFFLYTPTGGDEWWIPPWVDLADSTLLSWMFRRKMAVLTLRVTWSQSGTMSVWPDSETWVNSERWYYNQGLRLPPHGVRPLIAVTLQDQPVYAENELIVSMPPLTVSPSDTFRYRAAVFAFIVPSILFLLEFPRLLLQWSVTSAVMAIKLASGCLLILGVAWLFRGRPRWRLFILELKRDLFQLLSLVGSSRIYGWGVRRSLETLDSLEKGQRRKPKKEKG